MSYPNILSLLDAQLDRLRTARSILTSGTDGASETINAGELAGAVEGLDAGKARLSSFAPVLVEPVRIAPRQRRERRVVQRGKRQEEQSALQNAAPQTPVYVSADKVRSAHSQKREAETASAQKNEALSPELLARRWLQTLG